MTTLANRKPDYRYNPPLFLWVLVFAFSISLFNLGGYILAGLTIGFLLLNTSSIKINIVDVLLLVFSITYFSLFAYYADEIVSITEVFNYLIFPWSVFLMSHTMASEENGFRKYFVCVVLIAIGFFLHGALNIVASVLTESVTEYTSVAVDFWRNDELSSTCQTIYLTMGIGLAFGILASKTKAIYKMASIGAVLIYLYNILLFSRRTGIIILACLLAFAVLHFFMQYKYAARRRIPIIIGSLLLIVFLVVVLKYDLWGIKSWAKDQQIYARLTDTSAVNSGSRFAIWKSFFEQWLQHPFGGADYQLAGNASYVHNLWLDVYYNCGIIPFLMLVISSIIIAIQYFEFRKRLTNSNLVTEKTIFDCIMLAALLNCMIEPIFDANPYFVESLMFISGGFFAIRLPDKSSYEHQNIV